jgi:hypothetical protein
MLPGFKDHFLEQWHKYFPATALPIVYYYSDHEDQAAVSQPYAGGHCFIRELARVNAGESLAFEGRAVQCLGGRYYLGFTQKLRSNFNEFLSCGIPGQLEGERYKANPDLVAQHNQDHPPFVAPARYIVFKRWDQLAEADRPLVVVFMLENDALAGLFTLANYDDPTSQAVIAPFGSGCASIVQYPLAEINSDHPHAILGMFDISARPWVAAGQFTLALPWSKFERMVANMDDSFLITPSWEKIKARLSPTPA